MTAAIYARKSNADERSAADGKSIERQLELARKFCSDHGWTVAREFTDDGISGAEFHNRPGLTALVAVAGRRQRPFDRLVVMALSRLGRDQNRVLTVLNDLHEAGVAIWEYQTGAHVRLDTTTERFIASVNAFADEQYLEKVAKSTSEGLHRKAAKGHFTGQKTYGYISVQVGEHYERRIDPAESAVVLRVFGLCAASEGDGRIAEKLNADKIPSPAGKGRKHTKRDKETGKKTVTYGDGLWSKDNVRWLLMNELYIGRVVFGKTKAVKKGGRAGLRKRTDKSEWQVAVHEDLRIVPDELWSIVRAQKEATRNLYLRGDSGHYLGKPEAASRSTEYLLNGIVRCGGCGGALSAMRKSETRGYYYCLRRLNGKPCENRRGVPIADLEESVREALRFALHRDQEATADLLASKIAQARVEHEQRIAGWKVEHADQAEQIAKLETEIGRLVGALAAGLSSADVVATINAKRAQVEDLKRQEAPVMPKWLTFDRAAFLEQLGEVPITPGQPRMGRQSLRRLGVSQITVVPTADGWDIVGGLDFEPILRRLIAGGSDAPEAGGSRDTAGPEMAPQTPRRSERPGVAMALLEFRRGGSSTNMREDGRRARRRRRAQARSRDSSPVAAANRTTICGA
jgi:site-specific DNA recombinase